MNILNNNCTDAFSNKKIMKCIESTTTFNPKILEKVEKQLDEFEKISILFLISADDPEARRKILSLFRNPNDKCNVIGEFVQNDFDLWSEKLLEALCIIKNKQILRNLGFSPDHVIKKYLCNVGPSSSQIHPVSKVLFNLFEALDSQNAKLLLEYVYKDGIKRHYQDDVYLELHALEWIDVKYITVSPGGKGNLNNLLKHLKKIEDFSRAIYLDIEYFSEAEEPRNLCLLEIESSSNTVSVSVEDSISNGTANKYLPSGYTIKKGKCVIVNEENFCKNVGNQYEKREGSKKDGENVQRTFTRMGFDVEIMNDLTEDEMMKELGKVAKNFDHKIHDCLVVVILSHGFEGGVISADSREVSIEEVQDAVCTLNLQEVIKILIIQACQGKVMGDVSQNSRLALDGPSPGMSSARSKDISRYRNFARFMSTMNGFSAIRHKEEGSWFIQAICDVLTTGESLSVFQWQTRVIEKVGKKVGYVNECRMASQLPEFTTRLETEVYFPPYKEEIEEEAVYIPHMENMVPLQASVLDILKNY